MALIRRKIEMAKITNKLVMRKGSLEEVIKGADVFIGVSAPGCVTPEMVKSMAKDPIILQWQTQLLKSCLSLQEKPALLL